MLLYPLSALLTPFPRTFIIKGNAKNPLFCPFPVIVFISKEATGSINEETTGVINEIAIGAIIVPRNPPSFFLISCFTVSLAPSIKRPDFSSD